MTEFKSIGIYMFVTEITHFYNLNMKDSTQYSDFHKFCNTALDRLQRVWDDKSHKTFKFWSQLDFEQYIKPVVDEIVGYDDITKAFIPKNLPKDKHIIELYIQNRRVDVDTDNLFNNDRPLYKVYFNFKTIQYDLDNGLMGKSL